MSDLTSLSKESVKGLGAGAYLVNVLPSAVLVLSMLALVSSHLLPWSPPLLHNGRPVAAGPASVLQSVTDGGVAGGIALLLCVVVVAVLLRPFQIRSVQLLEGYWTRGGVIKALAIERHARRASAATARSAAAEAIPPTETDFESVARYARQDHRIARIQAKAVQELKRYPVRVSWIMPTILGNVLRQAETAAGERYGLSTVETYPRLYPYLSPRLDAEMNEQLNGIDVMATFVLVFSAETVISSLLAWRLDWWSILPVVLVVFSAVSYRGATAAADRHGTLLAAAFDLHRFDMLAAMRLPMPANGEAEFKANTKLGSLLRANKPLSANTRESFVYDHHGPSAASTPPAGDQQQPNDPAPAARPDSFEGPDLTGDNDD
jgi:hypothetical protein